VYSQSAMAMDAVAAAARRRRPRSRARAGYLASDDRDYGCGAGNNGSGGGDGSGGDDGGGSGGGGGGGGGGSGGLGGIDPIFADHADPADLADLADLEEHAEAAEASGADHALLFGANGALSLLALTVLQAVVDGTNMGRGLQSFTSQLNLSAFYGKGVALRDCAARFKGVFVVYRVFFVCQTRLKLS